MGDLFIQNTALDATFDQIEFGFNGNETINFGSRQETGSALYQVDTVATIGTNSELEDIPVTHSIQMQENICVTVGHRLFIFVESGRLLSKSLVFDTEVNALTMSDNGLFAIVAEQGCQLHVIHCSSGESIASKKLPRSHSKPDSPNILDIKTTRDANGSSKVFILLANSMMIVITNILLDEIDEAIQNDSSDAIEDLILNLTTARLDLTNCGQNCLVTAFTMLDPDTSTDFICVGNAGCGMSRWSLDENTNVYSCSSSTQFYDDSLVLVSIQLIDDHHVICKDNKGTLSLYNSEILVKTQSWPDFIVEDLLVRKEHTNIMSQDWNSVHIVTTSVSKDDKSSMDLIIFAPFTRDHDPTRYTLKLNHYVRLTDMLPTEELIFILEAGAKLDGAGDSGKHSNLRLRVLSEALPEYKLMRLINKNKFEEAQQFCLEYNLDMTIFYGTKSNYLLQNLIDSKLTEDEAIGIFEQLKICLDHINDLSAIAHMCVHAFVPSIRIYSDLLLYAESRMLKEKDEAIIKLLGKIIRKRQLLATFILINKGNVFSVSNWDEFISSNLIMKCCDLLQTDFDIGACLFIRHQKDFLTSRPLMEPDQIVEALTSDLSFKIPVDNLKAFVVELILFTVHNCPDYMPTLIQWIINRCKDYMTNDPDNFPSNAIEFSDIPMLWNQPDVESIEYDIQVSIQRIKVDDEEETFETLVAYICDIKRFAETRLQLENPNLTWPEFIAYEKTKETVNNNCEKVDKITKQRNEIQLRYNTSEFKLNSTSSYKTLIVYIVRNPVITSVIEDALFIASLIKTLQPGLVYIERLKFLVESNRVSEANQIFNKCDTPTKEYIITMLLASCSNIIEKLDTVRENSAEDKIYKEQFYRDIPYFIQLIQLIQIKYTNEIGCVYLVRCEQFLEIAEKIVKLEHEFGMILTISEVSDLSISTNILRKYIDDPDNCPMNLNAYIRATRLAEILKVDVDIINEYIALNTSKIATIIEYSSLISRDNEGCRRLYNIALHLYNHSMVLFNDRQDQTALSFYDHALELLKSCLMNTTDEVDTVTFIDEIDTIENMKSVLDTARVDDSMDNMEMKTFSEDILYYSEDGLAPPIESIAPVLMEYESISSLQTLNEKDAKKYMVWLKQIDNILQKHRYPLLAINSGVRLLDSINLKVMNYMMLNETEFSDVYLILRKRVREQIAERTISALTDMVISRQPVCAMMSYGLASQLIICHHDPKDSHSSFMEIIGDAISKANYDYDTVQSITELGILFGSLSDYPSFSDNLTNLRSDAYWGKLLETKKISFRKMFGNDVLSKEELIPKLCDSVSISFDDIINYCKTYNFVLSDEYAMSRLTGLLLPNQVAGMTVNELIKDRTMRFGLAQEVINSFKESNQTLRLHQTLLNTVKMIDNYDHESIKFIFNTLYSTEKDYEENSKGIELVQYLSSYTRHTERSDYEIEVTKNYTPKELANNPLLANHIRERLPFAAMFKDFSKSFKHIIAPELNLNTYSMWTRISNIFEIDKDTLYMTAMKNTLIKDDDDIDKCLEIMQMFDEPKILIKAIVLLLDNTPFGEYKKRISKHLCDIYSGHIHYDESSSNLDDLDVNEFRNYDSQFTETQLEIYNCEYRKISVQIILDECNLSLNFLDYTNDNGVAIITNLYSSEEFVTVDNKNSNRLEIQIHNVCEEIAKIYDLDIENVRKEIMDSWITCGFVQNDMPVKKNCENNNNELIIRIGKLLSRASQETKISAFLVYVKVQDSNIVTKHSLLAMQCLCANCQTNDIINKSSKGTNFQRKIETLRLLRMFENIGARYTMEELMNLSNPRAMVSSLWKRYSKNISGVRLLLNVCVIYELVDVKIWKTILKQMINLNMDKDLDDSFKYLYTKTEMWKNKEITDCYNIYLQNVLDNSNKDNLNKYLISSHIYNWPLFLDCDLTSFAAKLDDLCMTSSATWCRDVAKLCGDPTDHSSAGSHHFNDDNASISSRITDFTHSNGRY